MKSGASDPFADDSELSESEPNSDESGTATESITDDTADSQESTEPITNTETSNDSQREFNREDLPYKLRRDKVKDERDSVHQLFVQSNTDDSERDARRDLEDRFEEDVFKLDAREAIYLAGMQNLDDAEEFLRKWGYDL